MEYDVWEGGGVMTAAVEEDGKWEMGNAGISYQLDRQICISVIIERKRTGER